MKVRRQPGKDTVVQAEGTVRVLHGKELRAPVIRPRWEAWPIPSRLGALLSRLRPPNTTTTPVLPAYSLSWPLFPARSHLVQRSLVRMAGHGDSWLDGERGTPWVQK